MLGVEVFSESLQPNPSHLFKIPLSVGSQRERPRSSTSVHSLFILFTLIPQAEATGA